MKLDRRTAWQRVAQAEDGVFQEGRRASKDQVLFVHGPWKIRLDTYTQSSGQAQVTYTRVRAYFGGYRDLRLTVRRRNVLDRLWSALGFGSPPPVNRAVLERFVVRGKPAPRVPSLFVSSDVCDAVQALERFHLYVKRPGRKSRKRFGQDTGVLVCQHSSVIKDPERLARMVRLVRAMLDALRRVGEADARVLSDA